MSILFFYFFIFTAEDIEQIASKVKAKLAAQNKTEGDFTPLHN